jgi:cytochrome P450/surfactin synthase thioesterase subunit
MLGADARQDAGKRSNEAGGKSFRFNPLSEEFHQDPYPVYERLLRENPRSRMLGSWVFTSFADVVKVLSSRTYSSRLFEDIIWKNKPDFGIPEPDPIQYFIRKAIVFTENPDHARLRRLTNNGFTQRQIDSERELIGTIVDAAIERGLRDGASDVVSAIAEPVPLRVMAGRLGLDVDAHPDFARWINDARQLLDPGLMTKSDYERAHASMSRLLAVMRGHVDSCPFHGDGGLIEKFASARWGEDKLDRDEIPLLSIMTFVAGTETTKALIGNSVHLLLTHPDQLALLRRDRSLLRNAVDEVMRYESPLQQTKRVAIEDSAFDDITIRKGEQILLCLGAANRDPAQFADPQRFDISRRNSDTHLAFGYGMRNCLGGSLAAMIAEVVIERLLVDRADVTLTGATPRWQTQSRILRSLETLPIRFDAAANSGQMGIDDAPVSSSTSWLRRAPFHRGTRCLLVCFPHAGGGVLSFNGWSRWLPDWLSLVRAQLPGRDGLAAIAPIEQAEAFAPRYLTALRQLGNHPVILYGHSLGAILAFDLARGMRRLGYRPPIALCVSGRRAPSLALSHAPLWSMPDDTLIALMRRMGGPMVDVFDNPRWRNNVFPLMRADLAASDRYRYVAEAPLDCPIVAFHGVDDPVVKEPEVIAWGAETACDFRLIPLAGRHFFEVAEQQRMVETIVAGAEVYLSNRSEGRETQYG